MTVNLKQNKQEQIKQIQDMWVVLPSFQRGWHYLDITRKSKLIHPNRSNLVLEGQPGIGKTMLVETYLANNEDIKNFIKVEVPCPTSATSFLTQILSALGVLRPEGRIIEQQIKRASHFIGTAKLELIIIDEADNLWADYDELPLSMLESLTILMSMTNVPFVLIGSNGLHNRMEMAPKLKRQFSIVYELMPFAMDSSESKISQYELLLKRVGEALPFTGFSGLDDEGLAESFLFATDGLIGKFMLLIRTAAFIALERDADIIEYEDLELAFSTHHAAFGDKFNPFKLDW
jgi:hypothetical protein